MISLIDKLAESANKNFVLVAKNHDEMVRFRDEIWEKAKQYEPPSLVKWWLPLAFELRSVLESRLIISSKDNVEVKVRGRSIDVLLISYRVRKEPIIWKIGQCVKPDGTISIFWPKSYLKEQFMGRMTGEIL